MTFREPQTGKQQQLQQIVLKINKKQIQIKMYKHVK